RRDRRAARRPRRAGHGRAGLAGALHADPRALPRPARRLALRRRRPARRRGRARRARDPGALTMPYPACTPDDVARFEAEGFLVVADAIDPAEVTDFAERCRVILAKKEKLAFDWAWEKGTPREQRAFRIVQGSPTLVWPAIAQTRARAWMREFAAALLGRPVEFWYDQYL